MTAPTIGEIRRALERAQSGLTAPTDAETIAALAASLDTTPADLLSHAVESVRAPTETPSLAEDYDAMKNSLAPHAAAEGGPMSMGRPDRWWESFTVRCPNDHVSTRVIKTERGDECQACGRGCALTFPEDRDGPLTITETPKRMTDAGLARLLLSQASLTTEQARDHAKRWAYSEAGAPAYGADAICEPEPLTDSEREQLFAWVRARLAVLAPTRPDRVELSYYIALDLDLPMESTTPAMALCEAAGWPS